MYYWHNVLYELFDSEEEQNKYLFLHDKDVIMMIKNDFRDIPPKIEMELLYCVRNEVPVTVAFNKLSYMWFYYHWHRFNISENFVYEYYLYYRKKWSVKDYLDWKIFDLIISEMD